jgi:hypothetical protein
LYTERIYRSYLAPFCPAKLLACLAFLFLASLGILSEFFFLTSAESSRVTGKKSIAY